MSNSNQAQTGELLSFQEYSPVHSHYGREGSARLDVEAVHTAGFQQYTQPASADVMGDLMKDLQGSRFAAADDASAPQTPEKNHNFWTIEYYQKYFDVNTDDVLQRILSSVVPRRVSTGYFDQNIRAKPDMYGPFWIATTLIFTIAISGNISNYLQNGNKSYHWKYDFHLVSYAATAIFCYTWLVPLGLWAALKWTRDETAVNDEEESQPSPSMMSLFCIYGYSLSIYIPVSILWTIQVSWLQWLLVVTAALLSGLVLVYLLLPALKKSRHSLALIAGILVFHFLLAAGFMLYFFHVPSASNMVSLTPKLVSAPTN